MIFIHELRYIKKKTSFDNVSLSDKYALLLDDSLEENQALREQLKERDEGNAAKFKDPQTRKQLKAPRTLKVSGEYKVKPMSV